MRHWGLVPIQAVDLIGLDVVRRDNRLTWHVLVRGVKHSGDVLLGPLVCHLVLDPIQNALFLDESGGSVHIEEDAVGQQTRASHVTWPHLQLVLRDVDPLILLEVFGQFTDLLEVLSTEYGLYKYVEELKDLDCDL